MIPTIPYLQERFKYFNTLCFGGALPEVPIRLSNARSFLGKVEYKIRRGLLQKHTNILIRISIRYDRPEKEVEDVLIHEMIHLYIIVRKLKDTSAHGRQFRAIMNELNRKYGRNIRISHKQTMFESLAHEIGRILKAKHLTIATAESCTAGGIGAALASVDGASSYYVGGVAAYTVETKAKLLGIDTQRIDTYGVVSPEIAQDMAQSIRRLTAAYIGIGITGYLGASGGDEHVGNGTIFFAIDINNDVVVRKLLVSADRAQNINTTIQAVLAELLSRLTTKVKRI